MQKIEYSILLVCIAYRKGDLYKISGSVWQEQIAAVAPSGKERETREQRMGEVHMSFYAYLITFEFFTTCIYSPIQNKCDKN